MRKFFLDNYDDLIIFKNKRYNNLENLRSINQ